MASEDAVVVVKWVSAKPVRNHSGSTTYKVIEIIKDPKEIAKTSEIILEQYYISEPGELSLLTGGQDLKLAWGNPIPMTQAALKYVKRLPKRDVSVEERLDFYLAYLEHSDEVVAGDAYNEVSKVPTEVIKAHSKKLPRERLSQWLTDKDIIKPRLGLYGEMLGFCGNPIYVWGNTGAMGSTVTFNNASGNWSSVTVEASEEGEEGAELFIDLGAKPGWTRYTYPHPFRYE
jgi:hypothetical protein